MNESLNWLAVRDRWVVTQNDGQPARGYCLSGTIIILAHQEDQEEEGEMEAVLMKWDAGGEWKEGCEDDGMSRGMDDGWEDGWVGRGNRRGMANQVYEGWTGD